MGRCIISYQEVLTSLLKNVNHQADEAGPCNQNICKLWCLCSNCLFIDQIKIFLCFGKFYISLSFIAVLKNFPILGDFPLKPQTMCQNCYYFINKHKNFNFSRLICPFPIIPQKWILTTTVELNFSKWFWSDMSHWQPIKLFKTNCE